MTEGRFDEIVYLNSGAIGEYLMTLHFFDLIREACRRAGENPPRFVVVVGKGEEVLRSLTLAPDVRVVRSRAHLVIGRRRAIVLQQTFGRHSLLWRVSALASRIAGASVYGFYDMYRVERVLPFSLVEFQYRSLFPQQMTALARAMGYDAADSTPELKGFETGSDAWGNTDGPRIFVNPRAASERRTLPADRWAAILDGIEWRFPNATFLIGGSSDDARFVNRLMVSSRRRNIAGTYSLDDVARLIFRADLYLGPDTGITHLAAFLGTPSVVIGTNSTPCWWTSYSSNSVWLSSGRRCSCDGKKGTACFESVEGELRFRCMIDVTDEEVIHAACASIESHGV